MKLCNLSRNQYFLFGILIGFLYSYYVPEHLDEIVITECPELTESSIDHAEFEPNLNLDQKPMIAKKVLKNLVRPRYYYSELGIREKLFIAIMTTQENIETLATAVNKTSAHLVDKIKFFINADNVKSNFKLKNIVGFTDTRENLRPFHILKYIADNYLDDYDYFFIITDTGYINVRQLVEKLYHISISFDLYLGTKITPSEIDSNEDAHKKHIYSQYCNLEAGIVLSSSVIRKIRTNLDWCVRNSGSSSHSINIGKCIKYSTKLESCVSEWQNVNVTSFQLNDYKIYRDLNRLKNNPAFSTATIIYPITSVDDFYLLHTYFSRIQLEMNKQKQRKLDLESLKISNGTISKDLLEVNWPLGVPKSNSPETRHDIITWTYLNETHTFMPDTDHNTKEISYADRTDLQNIMNKTILQANRMNKNLKFKNLESAYRKFDPVRGIDYRLNLNFYDLTNNQIVLKSYEVVKPLGLIEIVPSPYVTESTRIAILLPTFEHQIEQSIHFIENYEKVCMENQDNTFLMLVLLYQYNSPNKDEKDIFLKLKTLALHLSAKYKSDNSRIAWVSIRLPQEFSYKFNDNERFLSSIYGNNMILSFAAIDLALRKIGLESMVMICSNDMTFRADFLNRVRMNTIQGFQIFSPIGFMMYPCRWTGNLCKECENCDVGQSSGYFERNNFDVISFYSRDYVEARKLLEYKLPIVRSDKDIINLLPYMNTNSTGIVNILDMFVQSKLKIHVLRAIEPNLRLGVGIENYLRNHHQTDSDEKIIEKPTSCSTDSNKCIKIASKKQIGELFVQFNGNL
uniref:Hexosyltransferase n=1 Tax=Corethrella appendiculata TaxID=1370023 RepID=U5ER64_9DIPT